MDILGFPGGASGKGPTCQYRRHKKHGFNLWVGKVSWRRAWKPTPVLLLGESHEQRSLVGYSSWGHKRIGHDLATKQDLPDGSNDKESACSAGDLGYGVSGEMTTNHSVVAWRGP